MIMAAPSILGELIPCGGGDPIPLLKRKVLIGRRSHCDIQLEFPNVSSHHCELEYLNGFWRIQDLGSSNGIKINNERIESKWLMPGDVLAIAKHRYEVAYTPEGQRPPEDNENIFSRSLMEKAGLERGRGSEDRSSRSTSPPPKPPPQKPKSSTDEDEAMKWLSEL